MLEHGLVNSEAVRFWKRTIQEVVYFSLSTILMYDDRYHEIKTEKTYLFPFDTGHCYQGTLSLKQS